MNEPIAAEGLVLLTLVLPASLLDALLEALAPCRDALPELNILPAQGEGPTLNLHTAMERVRGRVDRVWVQALLPADRLTVVMAQLRAALPSPDVAFWVTPVTQAGRLA